MCVLYKMMSTVYLVNERKVQISFCWIRKIKNVRCVICFGFILLHFGFKYLLALTDTLTYNQIMLMTYCRMTPEFQQLTPKTVKCKSPMPARASMKFSISYNIPLTLTPFQLSIYPSSAWQTDKLTAGRTNKHTDDERTDRQSDRQKEREASRNRKQGGDLDQHKSNQMKVTKIQQKLRSMSNIVQAVFIWIRYK